MSELNQVTPAKAGELAQQIVVLLQSECSDTRRRAVQAAMMLLGETKHPDCSSELRNPHPDSLPDDGDGTTFDSFFNRDKDLKPSDHAQLCAAYHFSVHGPIAFSLDDLRTIANDAGVILPDRLDMTLNAAKRGGKKLFQGVGKGMFKPTASAGLVFRERWNVKPGKQGKSFTPPL